MELKGKVALVTGAGVRVGRGTSFGYAYSNRLDRDSLLEAASAAAASITAPGDPGGVVDLTSREPEVVHRAKVPPETVAAADKAAWLREVDEVARGVDPAVRQVVAVYGDTTQRVLIAASDGRWVTFDTSGAPLYDSDGRVPYVLGTARDVTDVRVPAR